MYNNHTFSEYQADIKTAEQWREFISAGRNKITRPTANNTTVTMNEQGGAVIRLHQTDIVVIGTKGRARLNSGGWLSSTTKERINRYTRAGIYQRQSIWYMRDGSLFYDGMIINADGTPERPRVPAKYEAKLKAIKKQAKQYASDFVKALEAGAVAYPSGGDCWACCMRDVKTGATVMGYEHIKQHIKDKYYVPSLLVNAGRMAGYQDFQIGMMGIGGQRVFINPRQNIYKYIVNELRKELA